MDAFTPAVPGHAPAPPGPLEGITVLSLAEQLPGPFATLLLADLGADVILVERPGQGDPARNVPAFFEALSRNKRSIALNLKAEADRQAFLQLVESADVVVEGYSPGTAKRLGIDYPALSGVNPRLVYASISGFGQDGPYRDRAGHDISYQGVAGFLAEQACSPGTTPAFPLADISAAMFAALAIVSALHGRHQGGRGTYIDVSLAESMVAWMTPFLGPVLNGGLSLDVMNGPAYGTFACADGRVLTLSVAHEDHFWTSVCGELGLLEFAALPQSERLRDAARLRAAIAERIAAAPLAEWSRRLDAARIPWSPVHAMGDVPDDPHLRSRGMVSTAGNGARYISHPVQFSAYPRRSPRAAPTLGEHTAAVLDALRRRQAT